MPVSVFDVLIAGVGLGLMALSGLILVAPRRALQALGRFGSTPLIHFGELSLRAVVGVILLVGAEATRHPRTVAVIGGFLIASALVLMVLPRRWHAAYSTWWAERITPLSVRLLSPISLAVGAALVWMVV